MKIERILNELIRKQLLIILYNYKFEQYVPECICIRLNNFDR